MNAAQSEPLGDAKTLKALRRLGPPPPYADPKTLGVKRPALGRVGVQTFPNLRDLATAALFSPGYTLRDGAAFFRGAQSSVA